MCKIQILDMTLNEPNRYRFQCEVVEVIHKDGNRKIKAVCNPGSIFIEIPDDGKVRFCDKLMVTGTLQIDSLEVFTDNP